MCIKSCHYLITLKTKIRKNGKQSEKARLDYKPKAELLDNARRSAMVIKQLKIRNKRLGFLAVENMVELGPNSNDDINQNTGEQRKTKEPYLPLDIENLYRHCKSHIEHIDIAEIVDRQYFCK